jgi:hypothetical protein
MINKFRSMGFEVLTAVVESQPTFLSPAFTLVSCLTYSSTLKMEATCSSETSVDYQWTIRRYMPEEITLQIPYRLWITKVH